MRFLDAIPVGSSRLKHILFWLLVCFVVYVLLGFFALPPLARHLIVTNASDALHRPARLDKVYFNPLTLHAELTGFEVENMDGEGRFVSFSKLEVAPALATLYRFAPVVAYLKLEDLRVEASHLGRNKYSFSDLLAKGDAPPPPPDEAGTIFPFALHGLDVSNATLVFHDVPYGKTHVISQVNLRVPFTSTIASDRKEFTEPVFSAVVNGDKVEMQGKTLPFDETLRTEFQVKAAGVDLSRYWAYLPAKTPVELERGTFTSAISLVFETTGDATSLFLAGGGTLKDLLLTAKADGKVMAMDSLTFEMERFSLRDSALSLRTVTVENPYVKVIRRADNDLNWLQYQPKIEATPATPEQNAPVFRVNVENADLSGGSVEWVDQAVDGGFQRTIKPLSLRIHSFSTATGDRFDYALSVPDSLAEITVNGEMSIDPLAGNGTLAVRKADLPALRPYLAGLPMDLTSATGSLDLRFDLAMKDGAPAVALFGINAALNGVALNKPGEKDPAIELESLAVAGGSVDLAARTASVDQVTISRPEVKLVREDKGLDLALLFAPGDGEQTASAPEQAADAQPWQALVKSVKLENGRVTVTDRTVPQPARLTLRAIYATVRDASTDQGKPLSFDLAARWQKDGRIEASGSLVPGTQALKASITLDKLAVSPLDPYLERDTRLLLASGAVSGNADVTFEGGDEPSYTATGSLALADLLVKDQDAGEGLMGLSSLKITDASYSNEPQRLSVGEIALISPWAALSKDEQGQLNLRRALGLPEPAPLADNGTDPDVVSGEEATEVRAELAADNGTDQATPLLETITIDRIRLAGGEVRYRDASVSPEFETRLSEIEATLTGVAATPEARPELDVSAKLGPTPIRLKGVLNPVLKPIYSDITLSFSGMELVPISPYAKKNIAYPITRGRLSADVLFQTENNVLNAENKLFIEQLELGPRVKDPNAPKIPVKLGIALLEDSNGDIELDLPVRGHLDDPNFRIGGIVFKVIIKLIFKAVTSPFSLLGSIFGGGGEDLQFVPFDPGSYQITEAAEAKLKTVAEALQKRPKLKLEVDGVVDKFEDTKGLTRLRFNEKLKVAKYEDLPRKQRAETTAEAMVVAPEEYEKYLYEAYAAEPDEEGVRETSFFVVKEQPPLVMEQFILKNIQVTDQDLADLAMQRARAVKDRLLEIDPELAPRVFLLDREDREGKTGTPKTRADLGLR